MTSIQKYGKGFRAFVALSGRQKSKSFSTRGEAGTMRRGIFLHSAVLRRERGIFAP